MKTKWFVLRKSMCSKREPKWFHDYYKFSDGTFQVAFFGFLFYTKSKENKAVGFVHDYKGNPVYFSCSPYFPTIWQFTKKVWWKGLYILFAERFL